MSSHDVREGGTWTLAQRAKNDTLHAAAMLALAGCRWLPRSALDGVTSALAALAPHVARGERRRAVANARRVLGLDEPAARALADASFKAMGEVLADSVSALFAAPPPLEMDDSSCTALIAAVDEGRGVVLPSAHLGPWERVAATLVRAGAPLVTLVRESYDPRFDRVLAAVRERAGVRTIPRGSPHAPVRIVRALKGGAVLGAPMDLRSRVPSVRVPFLGVPADTAVGPARLALRTRAAVVVATLEVRAGARAVTATRVRLDDLDPSDPTSDVTLTARINDELSRRILSAPTLWPWMHPRWD